MEMQLRKLFACVTAAIIAATGTPAVAQGPAASPDRGDVAATDEITVTARKREESLLEVPIAITAFGAQEIQELGLENINDIQLYTPGFVYESFASYPGRNDQSPRFRGISIDTAEPLRQTASVFVDGVFVINSASGIALNDIERVEVIKGPQSAFFGRNTFGGAINYISKTPGREFSGNVSASFAEREDYEVSAAIEGPLGDMVSGRLSAVFHNDGGHYTNAGGLGEKLGEEKTYGVSGTLFIEPTERLSAKVRASYFENDDGAPAAVPLNSDQHNCGPLMGPNGETGTTTAFCGTLPFSGSPNLGTDIDAKADPVRYRQSLAELYGALGVGVGRDEFGFERESLTLTAELNFDVTDTIILSSLTGYNDEESHFLIDWDETNNPSTAGYDLANAREFESFSQELRLTGSSFDDRLDWSIGVNYFDQRFESVGDFIVDQPAVFGVPPGAYFDAVFSGGPQPNREDIETLGIFGSLTYRFSDQWSVTLEGRRQDDDVKEDDNTLDTDPGLSGTFKNTLPRIIIDFMPWDSTLFYLSYAEGNQPGNFNSNFLDLTDEERAAVLAEIPNAGELVEEETLESFEFGIKHRFANGKGSISAAIFSMERVDIAVRRAVILSDGISDSFNVNSGDADIEGFELEGRYQVLDNLRVEGSFGYLSNEFGNATSTSQSRLRGTFDLNGFEAARFPDQSGSLSLVTENDMANGNTWFGRIDTNYIGERFAGETNEAIIEDGFIVNLRGGLVTDNARYELFVKNVTDEDTPTGARQGADGSIPGFGGFSIFGYSAALRDRRQVGVRVSVDF